MLELIQQINSKIIKQLQISIHQCKQCGLSAKSGITAVADWSMLFNSCLFTLIASGAIHFKRMTRVRKHWFIATKGSNYLQL